MDKPKKEGILNYAFNRWQFNRPRYVGKLSEAIRACAPKNLDEWQEYYLKEVPKRHVPQNWHQMAENMEDHLREIGKKLYGKIREDLRREVESITEQDCIDYVKDVVLRRTFEGYMREKEVVHKQVQTYLHQKGLDFSVKPAPPEWEGRYNVDFYIPIKESENRRFLIGLQVKPISYSNFDRMKNWHEWMEQSHTKFEAEFTGKVFIIFSTSEQGKEKIVNEEILKQIEEEIGRLRQG